MTDKDSHSLPYEQFMRWRSECYQRFGSIHDLPIISPFEEIRKYVHSTTRILDIGAGVHKTFLQTIQLQLDNYYSLDNDSSGDFDFCSFNDISPETMFDVMWANQILEHINIPEAIDMLSGAHRHLSPNGHICATVPNISHPVRYWADATHITPWSMYVLYSLFKNTGFHIHTLARYNKHPLTRNPIKRFVVNTVCQTFRVDWCDSLMIIAQKKC